MFCKFKNDKTAYGIIGLGRFGFALARELADSGAELLVVDSDEEKVREIRELTENAYVVKSLDKKSLEETGIRNCDAAIVCIGENMASSILTTLHLTAMGIPVVISKAVSYEHGEILEKLGAEVVYPERDMAIRLARRLETSRVMDFVQLSEKVSISKLPLPEHMEGQSVLETNLRSRFGMNIIAIENEGNVIETVAPEYIFRKNDLLFLSGGKEGLIRLSEWVEDDLRH